MRYLQLGESCFAAAWQRQRPLLSSPFWYLALTTALMCPFKLLVPRPTPTLASRSLVNPFGFNDEPRPSSSLMMDTLIPRSRVRYLCFSNVLIDHLMVIKTGNLSITIPIRFIDFSVLTFNTSPKCCVISFNGICDLVVKCDLLVVSRLQLCSIPLFCIEFLWAIC